MSLSPQPSCPVCSKQEKLLLCKACKVQRYCGREHQTVDRDNHKKACKGIKKALQDLDEEEQKLRAFPGDFMTPANVFENNAGQFWGIVGTRPYMSSRFALVEALLKVKTRAAVQSCLDHVMDILRLCRSDNLGVRDFAPALFLRLGKDQECYDFVKWWATTGRRGNYDWGNTDLPYLDVRDADAFEACDLYTGRYTELSHTVAVTLIKTRMLHDLRSLQDFTTTTTLASIAPQLPQEILDNIRGQSVSAIIASKVEIMYNNDQGPAIEELKVQVKELYEAVKKENKHLWPALLRPGNNLTARVAGYANGTKEQMQLVLQCSYDSWVETPGAIDLIREQVENDAGN
ncbi:hypothetical protein LAWI1_G002742 [Lachnellula willkommii]|uniref:MYND-type domain-containing protein n=1 Tax=Lachnellula willkommii TaxID=215461 RepID=A0A559MJI9_9HELO|nr:hypothetical protein LAWI1_G002742 [Lachnellula willkommii]